jgi:hypothetical protein
MEDQEFLWTVPEPKVAYTRRVHMQLVPCMNRRAARAHSAMPITYGLAVEDDDYDGVDARRRDRSSMPVPGLSLSFFFWTVLVSFPGAQQESSN